MQSLQSATSIAATRLAKAPPGPSLNLPPQRLLEELLHAVPGIGVSLHVVLHVWDLVLVRVLHGEAVEDVLVADELILHLRGVERLAERLHVFRLDENVGLAVADQQP